MHSLINVIRRSRGKLRGLPESIFPGIFASPWQARFRLCDLTYPVFWRLLALLLIAAAMGSHLEAHHTAGMSNPAGRNAVPETRLFLESEYRKAERGNRNTLINRLGAEYSMLEGHVAIGMSASHYAFAQKEAKDAALWGRPSVLARYRPFLWDHWLLVVDGEMQFPSSGSSMVDEPFYDASARLTFGYIGEAFRVYGSVAGDFPIGSLPAKRISTTYPWQAPVERVNREDYELEKSTSLSARISYEISWLEPFAGINYRLPYTGVLIEKSNVEPIFYREWEAGLGFVMGESYYLALSYRKPFQKIEDRTLERYAFSSLGITPRSKQTPLLEETFTLAFYMAL
ncbi:MAG: hypothetical protein KDK33_09975 [Leptospiraceae bacterium]|nr:hypothetical protein [Leptospiraceae bacterium]